MSDHDLPPLPYDYDALEPHLSAATLTWHHDAHHRGYLDGLDGAEETLRENRRSGEFSGSGAAMRRVTHNGCGHYLHTLFWENMSPDGGGEPDGQLRERIEEDFGSYDGWEGEFAAAAEGAGGWALLAYDPVARQLRNLAVDGHDRGALWGARPLLVLDVWEHSYYYDYGPDRRAFVRAFFEVVDWEAVAGRYREAVTAHE